MSAFSTFQELLSTQYSQIPAKIGRVHPDRPAKRKARAATSAATDSDLKETLAITGDPELDEWEEYLIFALRGPEDNLVRVYMTLARDDRKLLHVWRYIYGSQNPTPILRFTDDFTMAPEEWIDEISQRIAARYEAAETKMSYLELAKIRRRAKAAKPKEERPKDEKK